MIAQNSIKSTKFIKTSTKISLGNIHGNPSRNELTLLSFASN